MLKHYVDIDDFEDDVAYEIARFIDSHGYRPQYILLGEYEYNYYNRETFSNLFGTFPIVLVVKERFLKVA